MISINVQIKDHINIYLIKQSFTEINVESTLSKVEINGDKEEKDA